MKYRVRETITHSGDGQLYPAGAEVVLDHLGEEDIKRLVAAGVVEPTAPMPEPEPTPEPPAPRLGAPRNRRAAEPDPAQ